MPGGSDWDQLSFTHKTTREGCERGSSGTERRGIAGFTGSNVSPWLSGRSREKGTVRRLTFVNSIKNRGKGGQGGGTQGSKGGGSIVG